MIVRDVVSSKPLATAKEVMEKLALAEAKMRVDAHFVADLTAEQPPHWHAKHFAQDVP